MALTTLLLCAISLASLSYGWPEPLNSHNSSDLLSTCNQIAGAISGASQVFFPCEYVILSFMISNLMDDKASPDYLNDISHASLSSTEASACSVEPGSAEDVSKIVGYPNLTYQLLLTHDFIAMYPGVESNAFRCERWRTCHQSGIFFNERCTDHDVTLQRDKSQSHIRNS